MEFLIIPHPTQISHLGVVMSYATLVKYGDANDWGSISDQNYCFVQLNNNASPDQVNKLLAAFVDKHIKPVNPGLRSCASAIKRNSL